MKKIKGIVSEGQKLGKTIGYPTANIIIDDKKIRQGVYFSKIKIPNNNKNYWGMSDLWINPKTGLTLETFIFDFNKDIYNEIIEVELIEFIRENKKINNIDELIALLKNDEQIIRKKIRGKYE